jgi:hypothetical protein
MIIYFKRKSLVSQEDLPILPNFPNLHLEQELIVPMLEIKELLIDLNQELTALLEQVELALGLAAASEVKN